MPDHQPEQTLPPPDGWRPSARSSPFLDLIGPLFAAGDERMLGLRSRPHLMNGRGFLHAAVVMALADVALGRTLTPSDSGVSAVTASLTVNFLDRVEAGDWLAVAAHAGRAGRRLGFARADVTVEDRLVAQATGVFAMATPSAHQAETSMTEERRPRGTE